MTGGDRDDNQADATNEGRSTPEPAEGANDTPPPNEGSPDSDKR